MAAHPASVFNLIYAAAVLDAQGSETALLRRLEMLKESKGKEFVHAPLELIVGEILHIKARPAGGHSCRAMPCLWRQQQVPAAPFVRYGCGHCNAAFLLLLLASLGTQRTKTDTR